MTMLFVLVAHFAWVYFRLPEHDVWRVAFIRVGMIATPTFVIISGVIMGVLYYSARSGFGRMQAKLIDRGLFLLLVGHFLIGVALSTRKPFFSHSTDALGAAMILGPLLVPRLSGRARLVLSLVAYVTSWLATYFWHPGSDALRAEFVKEMAFGSLTPIAIPISFPLVPWFAVYLASSVLGERLAALHQRGAMRRLAWELACLGAGGITVMAAVKMAALQLGLSPLTGDVTSALLRVGYKSPPGPLYLLFYGGLGMLLVLACVVAEMRGWWPRVRRCAEACGEASLFIFIVHFYVFWLGIYHLGPGGPGLGLIIFALSVGALVVAARMWQRGGYNRLLTLRYDIVHRRLESATALTRSYRATLRFPQHALRKETL